MNVISQYVAESIAKACQGGRFLESMTLFARRVDSHPQSVELSASTMVVLSQIIDSAKAAGFRITGDARLNDSHAARIVRISGADDGAFVAELELLLMAVGGLVRAGGVVSLNSARVEKEVAPAPAPSEPLEVRVVALPARKSVATVARDADGNITETTRVEADYAYD